MSLERVLLQRCLDEFDYKGVACNELCIDINKLLAQPEPEPEPEPVAWLVKDNDTEEEELMWVEPTLHKSTPLYTAPPKREPIEDGELEVWYSQHTWAMDKQEYMWGFRDAEKYYGIGGGK